MYISRLEWDDYRIEHIVRHNIEPSEVTDKIDILFTDKQLMDDTYLLSWRVSEELHINPLLHEVCLPTKNETLGGTEDERVTDTRVFNL